jgi:hypothetical protein
MPRNLRSGRRRQRVAADAPGHDSDLAKGGLKNVFAAFRTVKPRSPVAKTFYDDAVHQLNDALDARRMLRARQASALTMQAPET